MGAPRPNGKRADDPDGLSMRTTAALLVLSAVLIASGVFLYSVPLGLIVTGALLAGLTVLLIFDFGDASGKPSSAAR